MALLRFRRSQSLAQRVTARMGLSPMVPRPRPLIPPPREVFRPLWFVGDFLYVLVIWPAGSLSGSICVAS